MTALSISAILSLSCATTEPSSSSLLLSPPPPAAATAAESCEEGGGGRGGEGRECVLNNALVFALLHDCGRQVLMIMLTDDRSADKLSIAVCIPFI